MGKKKGLERLVHMLPMLHMNRRGTQEDIKIAKFRWELLRRNENYRNDYFNSIDTNEESRYTHENKIPRIQPLRFIDPDNFCSKWRIKTPLNPDISFNESIKYCLGPRTGNKADRDFKKLAATYLIAADIIPEDAFDSPIDDSKNYVSGEAIISGDFRPKDNFINPGKIEITINLNFSKKIIREEFEKKLDFWKYLYEQPEENWIRELGYFEEELNTTKRLKKTRKAYLIKEIKLLKEKISKRTILRKSVLMNSAMPVLRKEFDFYDDYLKVWDLVEEKKKKKRRWTWEQIAKEIFPNAFKNLELLDEDDEDIALPNPESAITKVKNYYKKASVLINKIEPVTEIQS